MQVTVLSRSIECRIDMTADDWALYHYPDREAVAKKINAGVESALRNGGDWPECEAALRPFAHWGVCDTEGFAALDAVLCAVKEGDM